MRNRTSAGYRRPMVERIRTATPQQVDVVTAIALAVPALLQVLWLLPIADRAIGALVAIGTAGPVAFRRTHPLFAALAASAVWLIPTDGYVVVGYVSAFLLSYSV